MYGDAQPQNEHNYKQQSDDTSGLLNDHNQPKIKTTKFVYPQIYSYTLPDEPANHGSQKIGYTEQHDVHKRIQQQTQTPAIRVNYNLLWNSSAFFSNSTKYFKDKDFHKFLIKSGIEHRQDLGTEWFYFNDTPWKSKELFNTFRDQGFAALQNDSQKTPYVLRKEQECAVHKALNYFNSHENGEFLWNAKPRFGKTLASYDLARRLNARHVLIVTNRPAIANSWFDDFNKFIDGYYFISEASALESRATMNRAQFNAIPDMDKSHITFLSLQDLKGSRYFGGNHDKLEWIAGLDWDLLIIDEAHEGVDTERTDAAFDVIKRKHTLHLSGTPFKALANNKFPHEAIFNWTYLDEQKVKQAEMTEGESGDHIDLPDMQLYTYRISQMTANSINEGIEIDNQNHDYAFDLNEFFATQNKKFIHEDDVRAFLKNLTTNEKYPFSTPELRDELRHTFWYVGNRVESVKALEKLLREDEIFKDYKIIVAAGDGRTFEEEENNFKANEKSFDKVIKAIRQHDRTITLSCGQLTTGITIKEWTAVLMLTDITSPSLYMQAAFRAQNPYRFQEGDNIKAKQTAYLFDFAPSRVLRIYDDFANSLSPKAATGGITEAERKSNVRELLNYFPVISEDTNGRMVELDAEKVLTFPNALAATEIVRARFMTNLLFNDNIKNVFHFPKEIEDILDKMPVEKNKRPEIAKTDLDLDSARKVEQTKAKKINENNNVILGEKIYRANIDRLVNNAVSYETPEETIELLPSKVSAIAEPLIAKYKEVYKATNAEIEDIRKETEEKIKLAVSEFESSDTKDPETLKQNLTEIIEHDFVGEKVQQQETKVVENVQKTKEDEVRDHLRAFTRTIPMFIMTNSARKEITIDNFDLKISDTDFEDLTSITKQEFYMLRDGFDYEENGERRTFGGVFDKYRFNASIAEFTAERQKRADYFNTDADIFELIPNQKTNQIFTPRKVVQMMVDGLEQENPELFQRTDSTFIDLYMKSGMYITEIVKKLLAGTRHHYARDEEALKHILENQVYGLAPTGVLHAITSSYIFGFDSDHTISTKNFKHHDLLPEAKDGKAAEKITQLFNQGGNMMKFDAVVGNPPYQGDNHQQIYPDFYLSAKQVADNVSMIFPTGWQEPKSANNLGKMNTSEVKYDKQIVYIDNRQNAFTGVPGAEWTNIIVWKKGFDNGLDGSQKTLTNGTDERVVKFLTSKSDIEKPSEIVELAELIMGRVDFSPIQKITSVRKPYGLSTDVLKDSSKYGLPDIHYQTRQSKDDITLYAVSGSKYCIGSDYPLPRKTEAFDKWKVFVPYAWGNMSESSGLGGAYSDIIIAKPRDAVTETYQESGCFDSFDKAQKHAKYLMTKFARALLYRNKHSQHSTTAWGSVPVQDYSENWWSGSIKEIDERLMEKYEIPSYISEFVGGNIQTKTEASIMNFKAEAAND